MPGKNPQAALDNYLRPLRQSLACVTDCFFGYTRAVPNTEILLTLAEPRALLCSEDGEHLWLAFSQGFQIQQSGKGFKVKTLYYWYSLENDGGDEILAYHWHPTRPVNFPHLHVRCAGVIRPEFNKAHMPTQRVAFEDFLLLLIKDFHVMAQDGYERILTVNRQAFFDHCSWR